LIPQKGRYYHLTTRGLLQPLMAVSSFTSMMPSTNSYILGIIKLTPLRHANIPPPMALHKLQLTGDVIDVTVNSHLGLVASLCAAGVLIYEYNTTKRSIQNPKLMNKISLPADVLPCQVKLSDQGVLALLAYDEEFGSQVYTAQLSSNQATFGLDPVFLDLEEVSCLFTSVDGKHVCVESSNGQVVVLNEMVAISASIQLPEYCPWLDVSTVSDTVSILKSTEFMLIIYRL
jgi:elongator complex protein 1